MSQQTNNEIVNSQDVSAVLRQALEALEDATKHIFLGDKNGVEANIRAHKQCESLRAAIASYSQAIAEAEKQEPVGIVDSTISGHIDWLCTFFPKQGTKLYTHPQPAQPKRRPSDYEPLTDEEIYAIGKQLGMQCRLGGNPNIDIDYARAIEAAHGIIRNYPEKDN